MNEPDPMIALADKHIAAAQERFPDKSEIILAIISTIACSVDTYKLSPDEIQFIIDCLNETNKLANQ